MISCFRSTIPGETYLLEGIAGGESPDPERQADVEEAVADWRTFVFALEGVKIHDIAQRLALTKNSHNNRDEESKTLSFLVSPCN